MVLFPSALTLTAMSKLAGLVVSARSPVGRLTLVTDPLLEGLVRKQKFDVTGCYRRL